MPPPTHRFHHTVTIMAIIQETEPILVRYDRYLGGGVMTPPYIGCVVIGMTNCNLKGCGT